MRRIKAFIIASCSLQWAVNFKRKQKVQIHFKRQDHKLLFWFLDFIFDIRRTPSGEVWLNLKQRRKANYERGL